MNFILTLLILILMLGIIVFIHEFGHFLAAKKAGVYIEEFSIGMGPRLFKFKRKNDVTTYSIRAFPIGGFVAMASVEEKGSKLKKSQVLENKTFLQKFSVLIMGIFFNCILAIVLLFINGIFFGIPVANTTIGEVMKDSSFEKSGIVSKDQILKINGKKVASWDDIILELNVKTDNNVYTFEILKQDGKIQNYQIIPQIINEDGKERKSFGVSAAPEMKEYGFFKSVKYSFSEFANLSKTLFVILGKLCSGGISVNNLSGPVGVFTVIDQIKSTGLENILYLTAYLSVNVGVINLLPIPVFDGGRLLLIIIEKIKGKKLNPKVEMVLNKIGFGLLIVLMIYVTLNDILKLF